MKVEVLERRKTSNSMILSGKEKDWQEESPGLWGSVGQDLGTVLSGGFFHKGSLAG